MSKYACILGIIVVFLVSSNLYANDNIEYPDFSLSTIEQPINSTYLPWVQRDDLQYDEDASVYWNRKYRVQTGHITLIPFEYQSYDYNNKTDELDTGSIIEYHSSIILRSTFYECLSFFFGLGISTAEIDQEIDFTDHYIKYDGYHITSGFDMGFPITQSLTLNVLAEWRMWECTEGPEGSRNHVYAHRWYVRMMMLYEIFGKKGESALNVGLGAGLHYYHENWRIEGVQYLISPNNNNTLDNGSENYDIIIAAYYSINQWMNLGVEVKPLGIMEARGFITFIFM